MYGGNDCPTLQPYYVADMRVCCAIYKSSGAVSGGGIRHWKIIDDLFNHLRNIQKNLSHTQRPTTGYFSYFDKAMRHENRYIVTVSPSPAHPRAGHHQRPRHTDLPDPIIIRAGIGTLIIIVVKIDI